MIKNPFERNSWGHEIWDDATKTLRADNDKLWAEIEIMGAKLVKAEKVIDIVHGMRLWQQLDSQLFDAVKEYRGEETK